MRWTWDQFGIYLEPAKAQGAAPQQSEPQSEPHSTVLQNAASQNAVPQSVPPAMLENGTADPATPDHATPSLGRRKRTIRVILKCLHLDGLPGTRVQFYETIGKAVVIVQAREANPTWQEITDATQESGWNVEVIETPGFERLKRLALHDFMGIEAITPGLARALVDRGYFTLQDLTAIELDELVSLGKIERNQAEAIIKQAEIHAEQMEI